MKALWELQNEMTALTGHPFSHESVEEHFNMIKVKEIKKSEYTIQY